jgi:hypothetical protein
VTRFCSIRNRRFSNQCFFSRVEDSNILLIFIETLAENFPRALLILKMETFKKLIEKKQNVQNISGVK